MAIDPEKFGRTLAEATAAYKLIGKIRCPYLDSYVHFNADGFKHLLSKNGTLTEREKTST